MPLLDNVPLAIVISAGVYAWYRAGFPTPTLLGMSAHTVPRLLVICGWTLILGVAVKSVGGLFGDRRVSIGDSYVYLARDPALFWGQIAGEILLIGGTGAILIVFSRAHRRRSRARDA